MAHQAWLDARKNVQRGHAKEINANPYIIPVVFHVIHQYGSENVPKSLIDETIAIMNDDYRKQNNFIASISSNFSGIAADCEVEFRLATIDPNGNCTQGITRHYSPLTVNANDNVKEIVGWPYYKYLNIWVVASIEQDAGSTGTILGYAYFPSSIQWQGGANDGILVRADALGLSSSRYGRTLSHEVGHYLGLPHTFEGPCGQDGDGIYDTPHENGEAYYSCDLNHTPCPGEGIANIENFMSYGSCPKMFTYGQKDEMDYTFFNYRDEMVSDANLIATGTQNAGMTANCKPIADFSADKILVCQGESVTFEDNSYNGTPNAWQWNLTGATPSTSTNQSPTVTYSQAGTFSVSFTSSNSGGQNSITKNQYIEVIPNTPEYNTPPYFESFESSPLASGLLIIDNPDGNIGWTETSAAASTGTKSMKLNSYGIPTTGQLDAFITSGYNFSLLSNVELHFKVAYRQKSTTSNDILKVQTSINCGKNWATKYTRSGVNITGTTPGTSPFTPVASDWKEVVLTSFTASIQNSSNVKLKFELTNGGGNNIYIDDINITGTVKGVGIDETNGNSTSLTISPNPAKESTSIEFFSAKTGVAEISISDLLGREVFSQKITVHQAGQQAIILNKSLCVRGF